MTTDKLKSIPGFTIGEKVHNKELELGHIYCTTNELSEICLDLLRIVGIDSHTKTRYIIRLSDGQVYTRDYFLKYYYEVKTSCSPP